MSNVNVGLAPNLPMDDLLKLQGEFCAVEVGTRTLLGHGDSWEAAEDMVKKNKYAGRQYYRFVMDRVLVQGADLVAHEKQNCPAG